MRVLQYPCQSGQSDRAVRSRRKLCRMVSINGLLRCFSLGFQKRSVAMADRPPLGFGTRPTETRRA